MSDAIIRLDTYKKNESISMIIHVTGDYTVEELMQLLSLEETKTVELSPNER